MIKENKFVLKYVLTFYVRFVGDEAASITATPGISADVSAMDADSNYRSSFGSVPILQ